MLDWYRPTDVPATPTFLGVTRLHDTRGIVSECINHCSGPRTSSEGQASDPSLALVPDAGRAGGVCGVRRISVCVCPGEKGGHWRVCSVPRGDDVSEAVEFSANLDGASVRLAGISWLMDKGVWYRSNGRCGLKGFQLSGLPG
jgi:hypothetical protein